MSVHIDTTELTRLASELAESSVRLEAELPRVVDQVAAGVANDAAANARSYGGTGELASAVKVTNSGGKGWRGRRIGADVRQAFFLEYGSPNTGAPRPWLTAPAAKGHSLLADELAKRADPL